jgi:capsid protein
MSYDANSTLSIPHFAHGANRGRDRGPQFHDRNADIDKLIPSYDRKRLVSISSRLFTNMGVVKAAILQKADFSIGEAWLPTYTGPTDMLDGKAIATFLRKVWFPSCDVRGGIHNWHKLLELTSIAIDRDGEAFWLLVKGNDGFPRIQQIPSHRVDSGGYGEQAASGRWKGLRIKDGIIYWPGGRPAAYRIITGDTASEFEDVPASDVIHIFDPIYQEQGRGLPSTTHGIEDLKHCLASTDDERIRQMIISRLHLVEYNDKGGPDENDPMVSLSEVAISEEDGPKILVEEAGGGKVYMKAGSGQKIEQIKHESPGEIWQSFQNRMIRSFLAGMPWPQSWVWEGSGQGTHERVEVMKGRRSIKQRQRILDYAASRAIAWAYSIFHYDLNRVPLLDHPLSWSFTKPPRATVDDGREASAQRDDWRAGLANTDEILEAKGMTEDEFYERRALGVARRKVIARRVSEEVSAESGYEITVEDREMAMLTPNEMGQQPAAAKPDPEEDHNDQEEEDE